MIKDKIDNGKSQMSMAATEVNSPQQEAFYVTLQSTYPQEPKPQVGLPLAREEEPQVVIRTGGADR